MIDVLITATCSIDKNQATTFDNKSYPLNLDQSWHVMAISLPKEKLDPRSESIVVIGVRQTGSDKKV